MEDRSRGRRRERGRDGHPPLSPALNDSYQAKNHRTGRLQLTWRTEADDEEETEDGGRGGNREEVTEENKREKRRKPRKKIRAEKREGREEGEGEEGE